MQMSIQVLEYIKKNYKDHAIEANGVVIARYFAVEDHYKAEAYMEQNLLNIILEGKKMLHTKKGDVEVRAGEAFFLSRGEYVMSEVCEGGNYACLLIFFDEKVIGNWLSPILEKIPLHVKMPSHTPEPFCKIELTPIMKSTALSLLPFIEQKPAFVDKILVLKLQELLLLFWALLRVKSWSLTFIHCFQEVSIFWCLWRRILCKTGVLQSLQNVVAEV